MVTVAVVGGGYGGISVAKALDEAVDVVLVEPKNARPEGADLMVGRFAALFGRAHTSG
jgi:NADH dehydrogenase FAD-containing subunit